jgi:hypothetical protein
MTPSTAAVGNRAALPLAMGRHIVAERTVRAPRKRQISREAGRAIEMLGHAIEYLADEFALDCMSGHTRVYRGMHPRIEAIELLMARNREIYLSCPEIPSLSERLRSWLRSRFA